LLKDLDEKRIPIELGENKLYLRYNLNSRRYLEEAIPDLNGFLQKDSRGWNPDEIMQLLRAGLMDCFFEENEKAIENRDFDSVVPSLAELGRYIDQAELSEISLKIIRAFIASLPSPQVGANPRKGGRK